MNFRPGIPRYMQIADAIRRDLKSEGERIPSEHALCATYRVSRPTIRQALDVLVQEGRLYRHAGRGTFATAVAGNDRRLRVIGSIDDIMAMGAETWFEVLTRERMPVPANIAQALRLPPGSHGYRICEGKPMLGAQPVECVHFGLPAENWLANAASKLAVFDDKIIGLVGVKAHKACNPRRELPKPPGNEGGIGAIGFHGGHQGNASGRERDVVAHDFVNHACIKSSHESNARTQCIGEINLTAHGS